MSEIQNEAYAKACQEIEKLRLENSQPREEVLELGRTVALYRAAWTSASAGCQDEALQILVDPRCRCAGEGSIRYGYSISPRTAKGGRVNYGHLTTFPRGKASDGCNPFLIFCGCYDDFGLSVKNRASTPTNTAIQQYDIFKDSAVRVR
jgi:hypothetical protein